MRITNLFVTTIATTLILSACGGSTPPPVTGTGPTQAEIDARNDSIAAARSAEDARQEAERDAERREQERMNRDQDQARATLEAVVQFDYDESVITAAGERILRAKLPILRNSPTVRLRLEGHHGVQPRAGKPACRERDGIPFGLWNFGGSVRDDLVRGRAAGCQPKRRGGLGSEPSRRIRDHGWSDRD